MDRKRIAFIYYKYAIENSPTILNFAYELADAGYIVDIFINDLPYNKNFNIEYPNVNLLVFNKYPKILYRNIPKYFIDIFKKNGFLYNLARFCYSIAHKIIHLFINLRHYLNYKKCLKIYDILGMHILSLLEKHDEKITSFIDFCRSKISSDRYCFIFGIEPYGLILAKILSEDKIPYIYLNLELNYSNKIDDSYAGKFIHCLEKWSNKNSYFSIIQDTDRAKILSERNDIDLNDIFLLPVSVRGNPIYMKSNYLQNKFNFRDKKIILYAGIITDWSRCYELAQCTKNWSENYVLVIHGFGYTESYLSKIEEVAESNRNIYLSTEMVSFEELDELVSSADVGLIFYKNIGPNFEFIGSASGKLTQYLKCGLPVVCNDYKSIREIVDYYQIGKYTNNFNEINDKLNHIFKNYHKYHSNAYKCYLDKYEFSKNVTKIIEKINEKIMIDTNKELNHKWVVNYDE